MSDEIKLSPPTSPWPRAINAVTLFTEVLQLTRTAQHHLVKAVIE
ncbi:MAG: hypothetical protein ACK2UN_10045 [Candidatus Promineifilaceae bacterium]|jgi:hypothetical protein